MELVGIIVTGMIFGLVIHVYVRWQKRRDNARWPGMWR